MALHSLYRVPLLVKGKASGAQRNALIYLHVIADGAGLSYDYPGAVIDEEIFTDRRPRMYIYPCLLVGNSDIILGIIGTLRS